MKAAEVTLEEALRRARLHKNEGDLIVAERAYRDILAAHAEQPDLLHEPGRPGEAAAMGERTIAADADDATHIVVGTGYLNQGELEAADRIYECGIEWPPFNTGERETSDYGGARL